MTSPTVLLVGAHGFGSVHLRNLARLGERVSLIALADPKGPPTEGFGADVPCWPTLDAALADGIRPDIVIVATPTNTHFALAQRALEAGSDVYLEKPPVATMQQFTDLLDLQARTGRAIQVGFQSFGSHALTELAALGPATSVATWASWRRDLDYWNRSAWAGKRTLDGQPVVDGVLTNALSHAIATALHIAGARRREDVARVELELYRANDIEADDTSSVRITLADGRIVSAALTLAADEQTEPQIEVRTRDVDVVFTYTQDLLAYPDGRTSNPGRTDLFEQLLEHRETGAPLLSALVDTGAYMAVLEAVRTAPDPMRIPDAATRRVPGNVSVPEIAEWVERTARAGALFREVRAPFAVAAADAGSGMVDPTDAAAPPSAQDAGAAASELQVAGRVVAVRNDGSDVARTLGPRPYLHPVRTPGGVVVTDAFPADHAWHLGVSVVVQHANGVNFWGGPTYTPDAGYRWLEDHGRIRPTGFSPDDTGFTTTADWLTPDGDVLLTEHTTWRLAPSDDARAWTFRTATTLRAASDPVEVASPGALGRTGAGYGGFTWRLPAASDVDVRTPDASGADAVHGTVAPWLAFSARFADGEATVALAPDDDRTARDPWLVRVGTFIGSALAWERPVRLDAGAELTLSFRGLVADDRLTDDDVTTILGAA